MKTLSLSSTDRMNITNLMQQKPKGNRLEMSLLYNLMRKVEFTPEEVEIYGIRSEGNAVYASQEFEIQVELSEQQIQLVKELGDIAASKNELWLHEIPTLDKFDNI